MIEILHWIALGITLLISFRLFRDLADWSQMIVQSSRATTMWTFYKRHRLAAATVVAWLVAAATWWFAGSGVTWVFTIVSIVVALFWFLGYPNPGIMMRSQQHDAKFISVEEATKYVAPGDSVIVMEAHGEARAHPDEHILRPHVAGEALDLGVMTQLENNLVMWDKKSGEPVQQFWGTLEKDGQNGPRMPEWPSFRMPFEKFAATFPDGKVFVNLLPSFFKNPFLAVYDRVMQKAFTWGIGQQDTKEAPAFPTIKHFDDRLRNKERIYGVNVGEDYVAYTESFIHESGDLLNTQIGDRDVVIAYHPAEESVGIYYNDTGGPVSRVEFGGESDRGKLSRVESMKAQAYWVVWANFFPDTDVNRPPLPKQ